MNFLTELKRRNVYRAAVAYGVVAWFLTQLTTQVLPPFEIPNSAMRFVVIALVVGFPIAMLLAWLYELTPERIVRTEDLRPAQARSIQRATGRILDFIIIDYVSRLTLVGRTLETAFRTLAIESCDARKKTSFTATPKRIFKFLGRLINSFSHFFQFISLDVCGQSTFRTCDFRILLEIGNFNLRRVAASLAFDWELSVGKEIRFHFRETFNTW
jgi:hypothetical protein